MQLPCLTYIGHLLNLSLPWESARVGFGDSNNYLGAVTLRQIVAYQHVHGSSLWRAAQGDLRVCRDLGSRFANPVWLCLPHRLATIRAVVSRNYLGKAHGRHLRSHRIPPLQPFPARRVDRQPALVGRPRAGLSDPRAGRIVRTSNG